MGGNEGTEGTMEMTETNMNQRPETGNRGKDENGTKPDQEKGGEIKGR